MDQLNPLPPRNPSATSRAEQWAAEYFRQVAKQSVPVLTNPPSTREPEMEQVLHLTLYRRVPGSYPPIPAGEKRLTFPDKTGYVAMEGVNVNLDDLRVTLQSDEAGWDIVLNRPGEGAGAPSSERRNVRLQRR